MGVIITNISFLPFLIPFEANFAYSLLPNKRRGGIINGGGHKITENFQDLLKYIMPIKGYKWSKMAYYDETR